MCGFHKTHCAHKAFCVQPARQRNQYGPVVRRHWSDSHLYMSSDELSIELPLDDVLRIAGAPVLEPFCHVHSCFVLLLSCAVPLALSLYDVPCETCLVILCR